MDSKNKCVKDAHGNCSRWCDHPEGKGKKVPDEQVGTLTRGGKIKYGGGEFDVRNVSIAHSLTTNNRTGVQWVALTVVLTRPHLNPEEQR